MERPTHCPDCGKSCTEHTGTYCHYCGAPLVREHPICSICYGPHTSTECPSLDAMEVI